VTTLEVTMGLWAWPVLLLGSLAAGLALVVLLIVPRRWDLVALAAMALLLTVAFQGLISILTEPGRTEVVIAAAVIALGAAAGGYALGAALLARHRIRPRIVDISPPAPAAPGTPAQAVVLLAPVEPADYRFETVCAEFGDLTDANVPLPADMLLPLFYAARRDSYRAVGTSDAPAAAMRIAARLERVLADAGIGPTTVCVALTSASPRLGEVIARLAREGSTRAVVVPLCVGASYRTDKALAELDAAHPGAAGVTVVDAVARWVACGIPELVADRVMRVTHVPCAAAGVVLVSEGRPEAWDRVQPNAAHEETFIVQRVRATLAEAGYDPAHVVHASLEWREPGAADAASALFGSGCSQVIVAPATLPVDGTTTIVDLKHLARRVARGRSSDLTVLPAWGDDPVVADALLDAVGPALAAGPHTGELG
jgi:protoheme ferro-lyase